MIGLGFHFGMSGLLNYDLFILLHFLTIEFGMNLCYIIHAPGFHRFEGLDLRRVAA